MLKNYFIWFHYFLKTKYIFKKICHLRPPPVVVEVVVPDLDFVVVIVVFDGWICWAIFNLFANAFDSSSSSNSSSSKSLAVFIVMKLGSKIWVGFRSSLGYNNCGFFYRNVFRLFCYTNNECFKCQVLGWRFELQFYWLWVMSARPGF